MRACWPVLLGVLGLLVLAAPLRGEPMPIPAHNGFVADPQHVLPEEGRARISARLQQLEREHGSQLAVVIVDHTEPETLEDFAQRVFTTWQLGRKGIDDGVLFVLALHNTSRRMRIHVGYGLEGTIPDVVAKRILTEQVRPALEEQGAAAAVEAAVASLTERLESADLVTGKERHRAQTSQQDRERLIMGTAAHIVLILLASLLFTLPVGMRVRSGLVWLVGLAAFLLYAWVAGSLAGRVGAVVWLVLPLTFQLRYVPGMRAKAQAAAEKLAEAKRRVAHRQGRDVANIRAVATYAAATGQPPGLLRWLPYGASGITLFLIVSAMGSLSLPALGVGVAWGLFAFILGLFLNGTFLRNRRSGFDDGTEASWRDYGSSWSLRRGGSAGDGSSGGSGGSSAGGGAGGGGDSGGGGASD